MRTCRMWQIDCLLRMQGRTDTQQETADRRPAANGSYYLPVADTPSRAQAHALPTPTQTTGI